MTTYLSKEKLEKYRTKFLEELNKRIAETKGLKIETPEDKLSYQTTVVFYETKG